MSNPITLILKSTIFPSKAEPLKAILQEVVAHCQATEPDMLQYDWYINADESECIVVEKYASSEGLLFHFGNYARFRPQMAECREFKELNVLGVPTDELRQLLSGLNAAEYRPYFSMTDK